MLKQLFLLICLLIITSSYAQSITSAQECSSCHTHTYKQWSKSRHANSSISKSPIYSAMFKRTELDNKADCMTCHEPVKALDKTGFLSKSLSNEGVTCDICHAFKVEEHKKQYILVPVEGNKKMGPYNDAISTIHQHEYSKDLGLSKSCLVCHSNKNNPHGITFIDIEQEWKQSEYFKMDIQCQDCHVPAVSGKTADLGKIRDRVYNHQFFGGFSDEMLRNSVSMDIKITKIANTFELTAILKNTTAGHNIPTGSPLRMLVLKLEARDELGQTVWKNYYYNPIQESPQSVFMKLLQDENGTSPVLPWNATGQRFDTRLFPNQERIVKYQIGSDNVQTVRATLEYHLAPPPLLREMGIVDDDFTQTKVIATSFYRIDE